MSTGGIASSTRRRHRSRRSKPQNSIKKPVALSLLGGLILLAFIAVVWLAYTGNQALDQGRQLRAQALILLPHHRILALQQLFLRAVPALPLPNPLLPLLERGEGSMGWDLKCFEVAFQGIIRVGVRLPLPSHSMQE